MARKFKIPFIGTEIAVGKRLFGVGKEDQYDYFGLAGYTTDTKVFRKLRSYKGIVYACINLIAESYASYEPIISRRSGTELKPLVDHELLQLLNNPGGKTPKAVPISMFDLLYATAAFIELQGDVYWYMALGENTRKPKEIVILRADKVGRDLDEQGEIKNYFVRNHGQKIIIEIDEMLPFIGFNPEDPYSGIGTTEAAEDYIETDKFTTIFTKNFFKNNAGISGVLSVVGDITKNAFRKMVRAWRDKYQGVDNAGKVMIVRGSEASFEKVGLGLNELDMSALRKMSQEDIAMMFRVPFALLGRMSEGTGLGRANIETLEYIFAKYNIDKKMQRLDDILQFALERYWKVSDLVVSHANIIPEDKEFILNELDKGVDRWYTRNEIRAKKGLPDKDGGDELYVPFSSLPLGEASLGSGSSDDSSKSSGIKIKIHRKTVEAASPHAKKKDAPGEPEQQEPASVAKENFRLRLMKNQTLYERRYTKKLKPILVDQRKEALYNLEAHASSVKSIAKFTKAQLKLFDDAAADALFQEQLVPTLFNLGEDQGALALLFAGDKDNQYRMTAAYESLVRASTRKMAQRFNDETLERLNKTLAIGIQEGESLSKLKNRIDDVYDYTESYRTMRVARTETLKASNNATNDAYKQTGYVTGKEWYVNPDACEICEAFEGKTIGLDETFVKQGESYTYTDTNGDEQSIENSYDDVDNPPLHPNCRCTIIPVR